MTHLVLVAVAASSSSGNDVEPGVLGFLVVAAMGVVLVFLFRSMAKQFRKITPDPGPDPPGGPAQDGGEAGEPSPSGQHQTSQHETARQEAPK